MKFSIFPNESGDGDERNFGDNGNSNSCNLLFPHNSECTIDSQHRPALKLAPYWFMQKYSCLVLVDRKDTQNKGLSKFQPITNDTLAWANSLALEIIGRVVPQPQQVEEDYDDFDFLGFDTEETHTKTQDHKRSSNKSSEDGCNEISKPSMI